jgi:hypothetical protein
MLAGMIDPMALTCRPMIALKRIARLVHSSSPFASCGRVTDGS